MPPKPPNESWINDLLEQRRREHLLREPRVAPSPDMAANFCSNDYLNLAHQATGNAAAQAAAEEFGHGATASRLICGTLPCHEALEQQLATFKGYPSALLFGSGFLTNLGVIPALVGKQDAVFIDRLSHASIIDGARLSGARLHRWQHNHADHLGQLLEKHQDHPRRLVITESVFSMDGDLAPLRDIADQCARHGAMLMVDEAHATGVFGPQGRGRISELGLQQQVNISMGTLSKALGSYGGYVCCSDPMRTHLCNEARTFIYTTALPPTVLAPVAHAIERLDNGNLDPSPLLAKSQRFANQLKAAGIDVGETQSQIIPIMVGDPGQTLAIAEILREQGVHCVAIRPPTVPKGASRIRMTITLGHEEARLDEVAEMVIRSFKHAGIIA